MSENREICGLSLASLLTGMLGLFPIAIIFGHLSLRNIQKNNRRGKGLAIAGVILGYVTLAGAIALIYGIWVSVSPVAIETTDTEKTGARVAQADERIDYRIRALNEHLKQREYLQGTIELWSYAIYPACEDRFTQLLSIQENGNVVVKDLFLLDADNDAILESADSPRLMCHAKISRKVTEELVRRLYKELESGKTGPLRSNHYGMILTWKNRSRRRVGVVLDECEYFGMQSAESQADRFLLHILEILPKLKPSKAHNVLHKTSQPAQDTESK